MINTESKTTLFKFSITALCVAVLILVAPHLSYGANKNIIVLEANISLMNGKPLEGTHRVLTRLYSGSTEQNWQEIHKEVVFTNGIASIELGSITPIGIDDIDIATPNLHLFIEGDEIEIPLYSSFYSLKARSADHVAWDNIEHAPITVIEGLPTVEKMSVATLNTSVIYYNQKTLSASGTQSINWKSAAKQKITLTGNTTLSFVQPYGPGHYMLILKQDSTGSRVITWPSSVKWPSGIAPELSSGANAIDVVSFYYDGESYLGSVMFDFK